MNRIISILVTILMLLAGSHANAMFNAAHDNTLAFPHKYAGLLWWLDAWPVDHPRAGKYWTCGITLVDHPRMKVAYKGRVAVTAGHCLLPFFPPAVRPAITVQDVFVSFVQNPGMQMNNIPPLRMPTGFANISVDNTNDPLNLVFKGRGYTPLPRETNGVGQGPYKLDFAVIILDEAPSGYELAQLPAIGLSETTKGNLLTITGYGIAVFGNTHSTNITDPPFDNSGLVVPDTGSGEIVGDRQKSSGAQSVISVSKFNIETSMNYAQGDTTTCNGDSGSGLVIEPAVPGGARTLTSVVSQGDAQCRAVGTNTRVDTQAFYDFLGSFPATFGLDPILNP